MTTNKIKQLEKDIIKHKELYYKGKPAISDEEYDRLEAQLKKLDPENQTLFIVGTTVFQSEKVPHKMKMLSLEKTYDVDDLMEWIGENEIFGFYKIDGSSCSLIYEKGRLVMAKTRGDGSFGEKILDKALYIDSIPKVIQDKKLSKLDYVEVRGEIYCEEKQFSRLTKKMKELNLDAPTSQRNIVAGILSRRENIDLAEYLDFFAFDVLTDQREFKDEQEKVEFLKNNHFDLPEHVFLNKKQNNKKNVERLLNDLKEFSIHGNYLVDGFVFTYNDLSLQEELGSTSHHPRYRIAFKFQGESKQTKIKSIFWGVSRNGTLTPVAKVEPVELSGAMISNVTLHNYGLVEEFNLKKGDTIEIVRSGEVIPKFLSVVESTVGKFEIPNHCPSCGCDLIIEDIRLICKNKFCPDQIKTSIMHFMSQVGIRDLSEKRLEELIRLKLVKGIDSLYELTIEDFLQMDKVKEKLAQKLFASIQNSKKVKLAPFLSSLGIIGGGLNKCEKIIDHGFNTIDKILKLKITDLAEIEGFAEKSATDFVTSLQGKKDLILSLKKKGFSFESASSQTDSEKLKGQKICITGSLSQPRKYFEEQIKKNSGTIVSSVTKNTTYLLTNDSNSTSSKFKKANQLQVPIINEEEFEKLIQ